jgi:hypothetical protein
MTLHYKTGKTAARPDAIKFKFSKYLDKKELKLPHHPENFGHEGVIARKDWKMLGNDTVGDCVFAGAAHETRMWGYMGGVHGGAWFRDKDVLSDYSALTGYDPSRTDANGNNPTDQGTDMQKAASYRRTVGIVDGHGRRHKVSAYLALEPGNIEQHLQALYLFGAVGLGIKFPRVFMRQFNNNMPWTYTPDGWDIESGHYIPLVAKRKEWLHTVTWGQIQPMDVEAWKKVSDESVVYLSEEMLVNGKSPEAFDYAALQADLNALTSVA